MKRQYRLRAQGSGQRAKGIYDIVRYNMQEKIDNARSFTLSNIIRYSVCIEGCRIHIHSCAGLQKIYHNQANNES
jgi:hypothetical protein